MLRRPSTVALLFAVVACAPLPQRSGIPVEHRPSANYNERRPNFVILHHTSNDAVEPALRTLTDPLKKVSAHYLVAGNGTIYYLDDELLLQAFGYDVSNVGAAIAAFKRHFAPADASDAMNEDNRALLYCLILQRRTRP